MSLRKILGKIEKELKEGEKIKDKLYDAMRKAIRLSKQAIFLIHKGKLERAKNQLDEAKMLFKELDEIPMIHRKFAYAGIVNSAYQEYTEAHVFLKLIEDGKFVNPKQINAPSVSYLLGLADVIGELRRKTLDSIRKGDLKNAEKCLDQMEQIFNELLLMDEAAHAVSEFRRKLDIARRIIETTRGDVTIEIRRALLENSIQRLEKTLKTKE
jgi:translin